MTSKFNPAFDMPETREQAVAVIAGWGDPCALTFNSSRARRCAELLAAPVVEPSLAEHCKQCAEVVRTWPESKRDCLGKIDPVVERQPVLWVDAAYLRDHSNNCISAFREPTKYEPKALYTSQPAPVSVIDLLREAYECGDRNVFGTDLDDRIRACLDKVKEPNQ